MAIIDIIGIVCPRRMVEALKKSLMEFEKNIPCGRSSWYNWQA